jgi:hypothetical protein
VEAPLQLLLLAFLVLSGRLPVPWQEPATLHCRRVGWLRRQLCLPSVPLLAVLFARLSLSKAFYDLNIQPLVRVYGSRRRGSERLGLRSLLALLPGALAGAVFRLLTLALAGLYLDIYALFLLAGLLLLNLTIYGLMLRQPASSPSSSPALSPATSPGEAPPPPGVGWGPGAGGGEEGGEMGLLGGAVHRAPSTLPVLHRLQSVISTSSRTPEFINEAPSTILVNSVVGEEPGGETLPRDLPPLLPHPAPRPRQAAPGLQVTHWTVDTRH